VSGPKYTAGAGGDEGIEAMKALVRQTVSALADFDDPGKMSFLTHLIREVATGVARRCGRDTADLVTTLALRVLGRIN